MEGGLLTDDSQDPAVRQASAQHQSPKQPFHQASLLNPKADVEGSEVRCYAGWLTTQPNQRRCSMKVATRCSSKRFRSLRTWSSVLVLLPFLPVALVQ